MHLFVEFIYLFVYLRINFGHVINATGGQDCAVSIATRYGLDGPAMESRWRRDFRSHPDRH